MSSGVARVPTSAGWKLFSELLEYGGDQIPRFAEMLWCAYLFRLESAADVLWDLYPELQRNIAIETGHTLPRSWGDWIFPFKPSWIRSKST